MAIHVPNEEDRKKTYTLGEIEEWTRQDNARRIATGELQPPQGEPTPAPLPPTQPTMLHRCSDCHKAFGTPAGLRMHRMKLHPNPA